MSYYDKSGKQISLQRFAELMEQKGYRVVEQTRFPDGSMVSTVWLGIDHRFAPVDGLQPIIFETMDFPDQEMQYRYPTEESAKAGHLAAVAEYLEKRPELRQ